MMKSFLWFVLVVFWLSFLSGCGQQDVEMVISKQPLFIQTQAIHGDDNTGYISKSAKIQWKSDIIVTSQAAGRVQRLPFTIGDSIQAWSILVQLQDTMTAWVPGEQGWLVSRNVKEAQLALARAEIAEDTTREDILKQQEKFAYDIVNVDGWVTWSLTQIQLMKLQKDLEKVEFDYQAKLKSDDQTNENLITSARNIQSDLQIILTDTVTETDKLLGVTDDYLNDATYKDMRIYLWAKDVDLKNQVVDNFWKIKVLNDQLSTMKSNDITADNVIEYLNSYQAIIVWLNDHFVLMKELFIESIDDSRFKTLMATSQTLFATLQAKSSALNASITSQLNAIRSYFASYGDNQESLARQIESLRSQIAFTEKSLQDGERTTRRNQDRSEVSFDSQLKNSAITTESAQLSVQQALVNQSKLSVVSPIDASVAEVLVDIGQEVTIGTPLLRIVSPQQQIELALTIDEVKNVSVWQSVIIESDIGAWVGKISTVSTVADKSGSFKIIITLVESTLPTGIFVQVKIPVQQGTVLLSINTLLIVDTNQAVAYFWDTVQKNIVTKTLTIQSIFWDQVEIADSVDMNYEVILTDLSNYDPTTMELVRQ